MKRDLLLKTTKGDAWTAKVDVDAMLEVPLFVAGPGIIRGSCDWTKDVVVADDLWVRHPYRRIIEETNDDGVSLCATPEVVEQLGDAAELLARLLPLPPEPGVKQYPVVWNPSMHAVRDVALAHQTALADYWQAQTALFQRWCDMPVALRNEDDAPAGAHNRPSPAKRMLERYADWCVGQVQDWAQRRAEARMRQHEEEQSLAARDRSDSLDYAINALKESLR